MADIQKDLDFLQAAIPDLQEYVLSKDLYWPLRLTATTPGSRQTPQLTLGNLALSRARLSAGLLSPEQQAAYQRAVQAIDALKQEWRSNWSKKAAHEYSSRLNLWQQYLRELRGDPRQQGAYYANEVRNRAILALLSPDLLDGIPQQAPDQLQMLDGILRGLTEAGPFLWEPEVAGAFPQDAYWFLYVTPRK